MTTVFVAGATGYLGRHIVASCRARGWQVRALVRDRSRAEALGVGADAYVEAKATDRSALRGLMAGCDLVVSALGITRQKDGLTYRDVDFQANVNLLEEALDTGIERFAYVHVLNAEAMAEVPLVAAKQAFVDRLRSAPLRSTVICPSGFFSDMEDFLGMARSGRAWLFGDGALRLNPIHGADLAEAALDAVEAGMDRLEIGGPDIFTHAELASLAFETLDKPVRIIRLPDWTRRAALRILPRVTPAHIHGPVQFFLTAMGLEMVGVPHGCRHLADHYRQLAAVPSEE
ncbi:SDR family oxidoreductase [Tropicimonas sp. TH_r6]|uniref:SDR family oxidoreductase n=1 Tax=Tropicimonas sp. TH_r6 TaxID=3082085 RepID=UPI002953C4B8|nr:SDR family oxidoreductase [Tropicimonas sp. TH_r6]MDV7143788.1 SDR family oxidoreductase [Tropicimonas sp. TH_r6]